MKRLKAKHAAAKAAPVKKKGALRENLEAILVAVVLALFIRTFIVQAFKIPSGSMLHTLQIGDHILVNKFIYGVKVPLAGNTLIPVKRPKRGDIVVFKYPDDPSKDYIKRVIGVGGDTIEVRAKNLFVNGKPARYEQAIHLDPRTLPAAAAPRDFFGPIRVPEDSLFVMGDNRDHSSDSRFWGFVDLEAVKGKAFIIYWSWDKKRFGVRWDRLGNLIK
ncbi:MAG: signal peptidase I [Desulfosarcinaceae bacterium]|nr:signal peptidase I [Desulfosarcinaceae bacterium]